MVIGSAPAAARGCSSCRIVSALTDEEFPSVSLSPRFSSFIFGGRSSHVCQQLGCPRTALANEELFSIWRLPINTFVGVRLSECLPEDLPVLHADQLEVWIAGHPCGRSLSSGACSLFGGTSTCGRFGRRHFRKPSVHVHTTRSPAMSASSGPLRRRFPFPVQRYSGVGHPWTQPRLRTPIDTPPQLAAGTARSRVVLPTVPTPAGVEALSTRRKVPAIVTSAESLKATFRSTGSTG